MQYIVCSFPAASTYAELYSGHHVLNLRVIKLKALFAIIFTVF